MSISILEAASSLRRSLRGFDPHLLTIEEAGCVAAELTATAKACTAAATLAAARAEHQPAAFARQSGITHGQAKQALDHARLLEDHPDTKDALLAGDISLAQAGEIAETPGGEQQLLDTARHGDLSRVREHARKLRQAQADPAELRAKQFAAREFRHWKDRDGMICGRFALPPELGLPLVRRVDVAAVRARRAAKAAGQKREPFEAYRADALAAIAADSKAGQSKRQVDLIIVCDLDAWRRGYTLPGEKCHIIDGGPIPVEVAKELAKDAFLIAALHHGVGIDAIARFGRNYPAHLQTALDIGSAPDFEGRACAYCGQRWGLQTDHINPVANQGLTTYENLQALCWPCHEAKTEADRRAGLLGPKARARAPNTS